MLKEKIKPRVVSNADASKVDRETLLKGLECVTPALASRDDIPELKHIWFDGKTAFAYDGGLGIRVPLPTSFMGGVPGSALLGWLERASTKEVRVTGLEGEHDAALELKAGHSKAVLPVRTLTPEIWPFESAGKNALSIDLSEDFLKGLKRAQVIKASPARFTWEHGITLFPGRDDIELYTTNRTALAQIVVKQKVSKDLDRVVLPHGFVNQVIKHGNDKSKIQFTGDAIIARMNGMLVCSNLLDNSEVPDMPSTVNSLITGKERMTKLPEEFNDALKRALVLVGKEEPSITLRTSSKELFLDGEYAFGTISEQLPLSGAVDQREIKVKLKLLADLADTAVQFAIAESQVLVLMGEHDDLFLLAAREAK